MSAARPRNDPVRIAGWWLRWALIPAVIGVWISGNVDARSVPLIGSERITAVLLTDGQAYFGHLDDSGETGWLWLRDVYYLQDAKGAPTNVAVALAKRGTEAHEPADGMRINRERVLAVERVNLDSPVAQAIAVDRELARVKSGTLALNPQTVGGADALASQRVAAEHGIARGYAAQTTTLTKMMNELVLPISRAEAVFINEQATNELRNVRRNALLALAVAMNMSQSDSVAYAQRVESQIEGQTYANEAGVLLAPTLNAVVARAASFFAQVGDTAASQLTQAHPSPSPSAAPSGTASPTPSRTPSPSPSPTR